MIWIVSIKSNSSSFPPDNAGTAYSLFDTFYGLGCTLGPVIGSFLYALGGFPLPFWVDGAAIFVSFYIKNITKIYTVTYSNGLFRFLVC